MTGDHGERVIELVRDARQELSHGRQLLHLQQLPRALVDALLEDPFFILQRPVKEARVKQVPDAKKEFPQLEGLRQEVVRSSLQRPSKGLAPHIGREDEHGHEAVFRGQPVEVDQDLEARPVRHAQVQQDEVRLFLGVEKRGLAGIRRADKIRVAGLGEQARDELDIGRFVVDDQDSAVLGCFVHHD